MAVIKSVSLLVVAALITSGCVTLPNSDVKNISPSIQTAYFAELSAYYVLLDLAGQYKDNCHARDVSLQGNCRNVVLSLRDIAIRAKEVRNLTDRATGLKSEGSLIAATETLRDLIAETKGLIDAPADQPKLPPDWTASAPAVPPPVTPTT